MICCFSAENADAGIAHLERDDHGPRRRAIPRLADHPETAGAIEIDTLPMCGELERIGEQVLDDLLQPLDVGEHGARQGRIDRDAEVDFLRLRHVSECPLDIALQVVEAQLAGLDRHRPGFDFGQIQDVGDQRQ